MQSDWTRLWGGVGKVTRDRRVMGGDANGVDIEDPRQVAKKKELCLNIYCKLRIDGL